MADKDAHAKAFSFIIGLRTVEDEPIYYELLQQEDTQLAITKRLIAKCKDRKGLGALTVNARVVHFREFLEDIGNQHIPGLTSLEDIVTLEDFYTIVTSSSSRLPSNATALRSGKPTARHKRHQGTQQ